MPHFLIKKENIKDKTVLINDKETILHLVHSLRIKSHEIIKFIDEEEITYLCEVEDFSKNAIKAKILSFEKSQRKLDFPLCVLISVLKPEAMGLAIQNAVQVGAKEIYTVCSDNCTVKKTSLLNKAEKWQKCALEAFKQCERADIPLVHSILSFEEVFSKFKKENIIIFAEKYDNLVLQNAVSKIDKNEGILGVFGPEGGFSETEFNYFKNKNLKLVTLGKLIYKAPNAITAGLFGIVQNAR